MKFVKKLLPVLLAASMLAGACAAFAACAPAVLPEPEQPEEDPGDDGFPLIGYFNLPDGFVFRDVRYEITYDVLFEDLILTEDAIAVCVRENDHEYYREMFLDMEFCFDTKNEMYSNYYGDYFYVCPVENYPVEQCVVLWSEIEACGVFVSDLFVMEEG